jgi:ABC-type glycerol-3-phosphate transport system permease component
MIQSSIEQDVKPQASINRLRVAARRYRLLSTVGWYMILSLLAVLFVFPFLWMLSTSLKAPGNELTWPPQWIPQPVTFENYQNLFTGRVARFLPFLTFIFHSAYIAITVVVGRLIFCSAAGFAFARMRFPGSSLAFGMLMASLLLPSVVMIIPLYSLYTEIGWIDTHWPLIVPAIFANTFGVFLFRQFFMTLPADLDDAARIDGASFFRIYWEIALPQSKPIMATLAIFSFQASWNDFQTAMIYITTLSKQTLPVGLQAFNQQYNTDYSMLMAGSMIAILPILAIFIAFQRYFVQGISLTGIRG